MKKKFILIQSILFIVLAVVMLTVASFAWFLNVTQVDTFTVTVARKDADIQIYKKVEGVWHLLYDNTRIPPIVNDDQNILRETIIVPGFGVQYRVVVKNTGNFQARLSVRLKDLTDHVPGSPEISADGKLINNMQGKVEHVMVWNGSAFVERGDQYPPVEFKDNILETTEGIPPNTKIIKSVSILAVPIQPLETTQIDFQIALSTKATTDAIGYVLNIKSMVLSVV